MSNVSKDQVVSVLAKVNIAEGGNVIANGAVTSVTVKNNNAGFIFEVGKVGSRQEAEKLARICEDEVKKIPGIGNVTSVLTAELKPEDDKTGRAAKNVPPPPTPSPIAGIKNVILVAAGKGGVGKSTVAVNLSAALAKLGFKTGLVDADIHGPSVARMMGLKEEPEVKNNQIIPPVKYGVKCMSMGFLLKEDAPVVWRGPMISKALYQLMRGAKWEDLDFLVVDMPPGTGDIHLSVAQNFSVSGAVIVTTAQEIALLDVKKCISMLKKVNIPIIGIIENMSYFEDPVSHNKTHLFGKDGGRKLAGAVDSEFLGEIPLNPAVGEASDQGKPITTEKPESETAKIFLKIAEKISEAVVKE